MLECITSTGVVFYVDDEDADLVNNTWTYHRVRSRYSQFNTASERLVRHKDENGKKGLLILHRVIVERMLGRELTRSEAIDHIDRNPLNNSRSNLRLATASQNQGNRRANKNNALGVKGVRATGYKDPNKQFIACCAGRVLGVFPTIAEAYDAYCEAAREHFGEFAFLPELPAEHRLAAQHVHSATPDAGVPNGMAKGA